MDKIIEKIRDAKSIAVLGHLNADPDAIGSCFSFAHMMRNMGKQATVYLSEPIEDRLRFMGSDYVVYDGKNAKKHDLCVCLDSGDIERLGSRRRIFDEADVTVSIDHHFTNTLFAQFNYVDSKSSAVGEILCELFRRMGEKLDAEAAKQLYTAIASDTGSFKFSNVTPKTMREAANLLEYDFDHAEILRMLYDSKTFDELRFSAEVIMRMKSCLGGKLTIVSIDKEMIERNGLEEEQVPNIVDIPRSVAGTEVAVSLREKDDTIRVNLRSNEYVDVAEIALHFGGGGHKRAAGCNIDGKTLEEAEAAVVELCSKLI